MEMQDNQCAAILYAALNATYGIVVRTNDVYRARQSLYRVRRNVGDVLLSPIQIRVSPDDPDGELWLIRPTGTSLDLSTM